MSSNDDRSERYFPEESTRGIPDDPWTERDYAELKRRIFHEGLVIQLLRQLPVSQTSKQKRSAA